MPSDIKKKIETLRNKIRRHDYLYYVLSHPEISDKEYDDLMRKLKDLEDKHPEFKSGDSPTVRVGGGILEGFNTVKHAQKMFSLDNTYNFDELREWEARAHKGLKENEKTDQSFVSTAWQYSSGGFSSLKSAPGIGGDEVTSLVNSLSNKDWKKGPEKYLNTFGKSRVLPAMIQNLWKDRVENRLFFGATGVETPEQQRQDVINSKKAKK